MQTLRYEVDPHNRLIIKKTGKKTRVSKFRQVLDGRFKIDKKNNLAYHVKAPLTQDTKAPHQVKLRGKWSLNKNHNLVFTLDKWKRQTFGDQLTLKGDIIDVNKNSVLFSVTTRDKQGSQSIYGLKLQGTWQADKHNRLSLRINKQQGYDTLTLQKAWDITKNYQIIYQYEKLKLLTKSKQIQTLTFKGHWDIRKGMRISYILDKKSNSGFDFKANLGIFRNNYIKYELGIGTRPTKRAIKLFGRWRIRKNRQLIFQVDCGKKKFQIELSQKILKANAEAFLRFLKSKQESAILVGTGLKW